MLHLVYYLNCLAGVEDVREQNRQAFELFKLSNGENLEDGAERDQEYFNGDEDPMEEQSDPAEFQDITNPY